MNRVVWTRQALLDVEAIRNYISRDSQRYAPVVVDEIVTAVDRLERFPLSGRRIPERPGSELRELLCASYRIVYRVRGELVEVVTVFHGARIVRIPWEVREVLRAS